MDKNFDASELGLVSQENISNTEEGVPTWLNTHEGVLRNYREFSGGKIEWSEVTNKPNVTLAINEDGWMLLTPTNGKPKAQEECRQKLKSSAKGAARTVSIPAYVPGNTRAVVTFAREKLTIWDCANNRPHAQYSLRQIYEKLFLEEQ